MPEGKPHDGVGKDGSFRIGEGPKVGDIKKPKLSDAELANTTPPPSKQYSGIGVLTGEVRAKCAAL